MSRRRRCSGELKARIALEALGGDRTLQEIASKHQVHPNQVSTWKRQAMDGLGEVFSNADGGAGFFVARVRAMRRAEGRAMVNRDHQAGDLPAAGHGQRRGRGPTPADRRRGGHGRLA